METAIEKHQAMTVMLSGNESLKQRLQQGLSAKKLKDNLDNKTLMDAIGRISVLLGLNKPSLAEINVLFDYCRANLSDYAPMEFVTAFELAIQDKTSSGVKTYGILSAMVFQDVMTAYKHYTYEMKRQQQPQEAPEQQWTSADEDALYSKSIRDLYEKYKVNKSVWDGNWPGKHDWLAKKGAIPMKTTDKAEFDQLQKEALQMWIKDTNDKMMKAKNAGEIRQLKELLTNIRTGDVGNHREMVLPLYAKEIKVKRYFDKLIEEGK